MLADDLRGLWYIALKDLRAYYLKPPNISWGILFPFAFAGAFYLRNPGDARELVPGLVALATLFGATSMEAIVITFERRVGALERLLLSPVRPPAILLGKLLGGAVFGLVVTVVVLLASLAGLGLASFDLPLLLGVLVLSALAFSALGAFVSVAVREVFEAQTLANFFRFPMIFLCGVFIPLASLPEPLRPIAYLLPLTYAVDGLREALLGTGVLPGVWSLLALGIFALGLYLLSIRVLARSLA